MGRPLLRFLGLDLAVELSFEGLVAGPAKPDCTLQVDNVFGERELTARVLPDEISPAVLVIWTAPNPSRMRQASRSLMRGSVN